ncbi:DUF1772 domain-containing protein [Nocardiopsis sp. RSe5-2]|uniref:DUF1772 domain-containing protein n=1 Tax=Nocardiopsis endophytica TaxID=3018445 RepID=A0ABT4U9N2_9ACTN|nr:DUF1772 domain-containing protein [Nocardiopsis endophytica]MDA2813660.1 DUF1772 domain-containing protein [Nocardiopsis endophytica]
MFWNDLLTSVSLAGSGIQAGALLMVLLGVCPTLRALPVPDWIRLHVALDRSIERYMPALNVATSLATLVLVFLPQDGPARWVRVAALCCNSALALMSELVNVRINKSLKTVAADMPATGGAPGPDTPLDEERLSAVRERWIHGHAWRTVVITAGFLLYILAAVPLG